MEKKIIETNAYFISMEDRITKVVDTVVESFAVEGIVFSEDELKKLVEDFRKEIKIRVE
jgi:hypothetical protein